MKTINKETGSEWSRDELSKAFDAAVRGTEAGKGEDYSSRHWKDSIAVVVDLDQEAVTTEAIVFYTATVPTRVELLDGSIAKVLLKADGYWAGPAGDH